MSRNYPHHHAPLRRWRVTPALCYLYPGLERRQRCQPLPRDCGWQGERCAESSAFSPPSAPRPGAPEAHHQAAGCINHQPGQQRLRHHRGPGTRSCKKGNLEKAQAGPQSRASTNSTTCCSFSATGHRCQREDQKQVQLLPAGWKSWGQTDGGHCNLFTTIISSDTHISSITLLLFTIDILCSRALSYSNICCDTIST